ncbi:MAG TPA: amino acid adenylation domain-containing protein [Polyangium sp.]|nr:amino acid adenylation domain-containing protein [Polyangium sp.]
MSLSSSDLQNSAKICVHDVFDAQAGMTPEAIAVEYEDERLSYRELQERANRLAHHLMTLGVGPEVLVGLCVERSVDLLVGILAIIKAGGAWVPIDAGYPIERIAMILADAGASILLTQSHLEMRLPKFEGTVIRLDVDEPLWRDQPATSPSSGVTGDNAIYVIYTSGSTGRPKGVMVEHDSVSRFLLENTPIGRFAPPCRVLHRTSIAFDVSILELVGPLLAGGCIVMAPRDTEGSPPILAALIRQRGLTAVDFSPAMLRHMLDEPDFVAAESLRVVVCGGEALDPDLATKFLEKCHAVLWNEYGPTETTISATSWPVAQYRETGAIRIGRAHAGYRIYVLDDEGDEAPVGVPGELCIGGIGVTRGYVRNPGQTAARFIPDPFAKEPGARLYRTGDLACWDADGNLDFRGRIDHQIKIRGFRIEPGEIEAVLAAHVSVRVSLVMAREDIPGHKRLVAYIVPEGECTASVLREHLRAKLPEYMVPSAFVMLDALPLTTSGKVDRKNLPAPERLVNEANPSFVAPRTAVEQIVADAFALVLRTEQIGIHDDFFALGGHSLHATQLVSRLRSMLDVEVPLRAVFESPTVVAFSETVSALQQAPLIDRAKSIIRVSRDAPLPLSFAQQRLWFLEQMDPGRPTYNIFTASLVVGALDLSALHRAFGEIVRRHEAFRTAFERRGETPIQVIHEMPNEWPMLVVPVNGDNEAAIQADIQRHVAEEAATPFDLERSPLLRTRVLRIDDERHIVMMTMHHIISDGWSMGIFFRELSTLYGAFHAGRPSPLPELDVQIADIAVWQRGYLQGERLARELSYWKARMQDCPPLVLPTDLPRPSTYLFRGSSERVVLDASLASAISRFAQEQGATLFMVLVGAFQVLLGRYSRQDDFCIGVPIANRTRSEMEPLIGFFVNTLVLRAQLHGSPTFLELLARVKAGCLEAYAHQDVPFERLVDELGAARYLNRNPLFQVMFVLQNAQQWDLQLPGLSLSHIAVDNGTTTFDLTVSLEQQEDGTIAGVVQYATDLFKQDTIQRLCRHYAQLLQGIVDQPDCSIDKLPLLTEEERQQVVVEWNRTQTPAPEETSILQLFEAQVNRAPNSIAAIEGDQHWTYNELKTRAYQLAQRLRALGVEPDMRVGLCVERSLEMVLGVLGIVAAGGAYVPLDPDYPADRIAFMLRDAGIRILLTRRQFAAHLARFDGQIIYLDDKWDGAPQEGASLQAFVTTGENLVYVIYTSGSTGMPKGVMVTHDNLLSSTLARIRVYEQPVRRFLVISSFAFDITSAQIFWTLSTGGALVLSPNSFQNDPDGVIASMKTQQISHLLCVPSLYALVGDQPDARESLSSLSTIILGGETIPPQVLMMHQQVAAQAALYNEYGPTETTVWSSYHRIDPTTSSELGVPIGCPIPGTQIYILDAHLQPVPIGVPGELCIAGDGVSRGYLNRPELTAEKFVENPFGKSKLYKTGDLARFRTDGKIEFLGRIDHQVKLRGYRIELGEIETICSSQPDVQTCVAIVRTDSPGDQRLVLYVVPNKSAIDAEAQVLRSEQVSAWQSFFDEGTIKDEDRANALFNIAGWNSSLDRQPIPAEQMREWRDYTVDRIRELRPSRVWEIGCGSGLILLPLAPECTEYVGTDFSAAGIDSLRAVVESQGLEHVRLMRREAADCEGIPNAHFDVIIINSVVQYFPDANYLRRVLIGASRALAPGGVIFLGDIRNHNLMEAFHLAVQRHRHQGKPLASYWHAVERALADEEELLVSPTYLQWLCDEIEGLSHVEVYLKRGQGDNEMNRYRYDALLHSQYVAPRNIDLVKEWNQVGGSLSGLATWIEETKPILVKVVNIPNARVYDEIMASRRHRKSKRNGPDMASSDAAINPEALWNLGEKLGYRVRIRSSEDSSAEFMDALWERALDAGPLPQWPMRPNSSIPDPSAHVNNPLRRTEERELVSRVRNHLRDRVPEYMIPTAIVVLDALPLTPNGKVDRNALPAPDGGSSTSQEYAAPSTVREQAISEIFAQVLGLERVGLHDDFFTLGGHSLLAVQVINRLRERLQLDISVQTLFAAPTVAGLAEKLGDEGESLAKAPIPIVSRGPEARFPLSFAQERNWNLERRADWTGLFNMSLNLRITGPLDRAAFAAALAFLVERHESLRTAIDHEGGNSSQYILPTNAVPVVWEDLSQLDRLARQTELHTCLVKEVEHRFRIPGEPLCRIRLLALDENESALIMTIHHSVSDGWSMGVLMGELCAAYRGRVANKAPDLGPLPLQLADYASWERDKLSGDNLKRLLAYWRDKLRGSPILNLRTDHPRPRMLSDRGGIIPIKLSAQLSTELEGVAQAHGTTLFIVLLAAWQMLLCRYSQQSDIVVGTLIANRTRHDIEGIIGCFINLLALRTDLSGNPTFRELLKRANTTATAAYEHQSAPIELVIDAVQAVRDPGRRALFQTMVVLQNAPMRNDQFAEDIQHVPLESGPDEVSRFELMVSMTRTQAGLRGILRYATDLYLAATAEKISHDFVAILQRIVARPNDSISALASIAKWDHQALTDSLDLGPAGPS